MIGSRFIPRLPRKDGESSRWAGILTLFALVVLALFAPFVVVFRHPSEVFADTITGVFSSVTWAFVVLNNPPVFNNQMSFVLFPMLEVPILLLVAVVRVAYVLAVFGHRHGLVGSRIPLLVGALMFSCIMLLCLSVTFSPYLSGLPWGHLIPVPPSEITASVCYPLPALFLIGLLCYPTAGNTRRKGVIRTA
ncbi:MAG: hypothetical protein C4K49_11900 [Candidatus Thorarchaeota archaeon]|nr:MAG: hypothetical protein C4K49_11900 [Candidatus Thorarchaeota archaeon]